LLKDALKLSNAQIGLLTSAFFWVYAPGQLLAAWLVDRLNAYRALTLGLLVWSAATVLSGLANGFVVLVALRVLLGLGESAGFPASSKLLAQHLPHHRLGIANALVSAGISLGPAVGTLLGGLLIAHTGWRWLFILFGAASLLWLIPWFLATRGLAAEADSRAREAEPSFAEILSKRELWGAAMGHFALTYAFYLVISFLPLYLVRAHGFSLRRMAVLGGLVYGLSAVIGLAAGAMADFWMRRDASSTLVRKGMLCTGVMVGIGCMLACGLGSPPVAIAGLLAYSIAHGLTSFNTFATGQTLAGPRAAGKWMGVQNAIANTSGIIAPVVSGLIVDATGSFSLAFLAAAGVLAVGLIAWGVVIRRVEPVEWRPA
jgi:MFS family permease